MEKTKLKGKDLITIGVFAAIYFVLSLICNMLGGFGVIVWSLTPTFAAIICAVPYLVLCAKVKKPLLITVRYIPSIREERKHIKDAMKIRDIKGFSKIEYTLVPLIMSAINTSDELSAAAITRGIENPCKKTSIIDMKMKAFDYTALTISFIFIALSIYSRSQII